MEENLKRGEGFCMQENLQKMGSWEPVTPAKPTPARPELESISNAVDKKESLQNSDAALNLKEGVEDDLKTTVTVDHEKTRRSGVNGSLFDTETSGIGENSRNQNCGAETGERLNIGCMQQMLWSNANSRNQSHNGSDSTTDLSSQGRDGGITDNGRFASLDTRSGDRFVDNKPQNLRKRKKHNFAADLNGRPRLTVKKHRPKIFDETKPKRVPKSQKKPKSENERKDTNKPKFEKKRKEVKKPSMLKSAKAPLANSCITGPQTPEPSAPNRISSSISSCRSVSSSAEHNGKAFDSCSEHAIPSCKKALVYDVDVGQGASSSQDFSDKVVVQQCKVYTRRRKSFRKMDLKLNLEVQDFEFCTELRKIVWEAKTLKSQFEDFPITSKKMRMGRRKATAYPYFLEASKQEMLPTVKQFSAAIMEPKSFRCVLALQPKVLSRKKRSKRLKKVAAAMRGPGSNSYDHLLCFPWALESVNGTLPLLREMQSNCALPFSLAFPRRKRSQIHMRGHALPISTLDFGSKLNEIEIEKSPLIDLNAFPGALEEVLGVDNRSSMTTVVESSEVEPQKTQIQECLPYEDSFHGGQICMSYYQGVKHKMKQHTSEEKDVTPNVESYYLKHKGLIDDLIKRLEHLSISNECKQIVICDQSSYGALVPSKRRTKKKGPPPEVTPDADTMRAWMLLMEEDGSETTEEKYWEEQRKIFCGRVDVFIKCMHLIQGNRRFSRWKGSVVDSVVGVFLTQNVSDHLSSNAFMILAAKFPKYPIQSEDGTHDGDEGIGFSQESVGSNIETEGPTRVEDSRQSCTSQLQHSTNHQLTEEEENAVLTTGDVVPGFKGATLDRDALSKCEVSSTEKEENAILTTGDVVPGFEGATLDCHALSKCKVSSGCTLKEEEVDDTETKHGSNNSNKGGKNNGKKRITSKSEMNFRRKNGEPKKKQEIQINWDDLRKEYATPLSKDTTGDADDSVDWEAVRRASIEEIAETIQKRGMNIMLAMKIKGFLDRMVRDHGSIDLEWLRNVPPEKAKEFLLSIDRIGLKSAECVRLLTLHHHAFPVDTNVGRIVVRMGWVPLQPLPDGVQLHLLEQYPVLDAIQQYLWPRLSALDQQTLYELHYQMITFGKVFCTKVKPKCNVCPMKRSCKHFASAFASARLRLPGPKEKGIVKTKAGCTANQDPTRHVAPLKVSLLDDNFLQSRHESQTCEPIIEMPASPEQKSWETPEIDIEDLSWDSKSKPEENSEQEMDELFWDLTDGPTLRFNANAENCRARELTISVPKEYIASKALVLAPEAASFPAPKLRSLGRLHTEHEVYELPDDHDLLAQFRKREPDDPSRYLFAIWMTDKTTDTVDEQNDQTVSGTFLIPCRTANNGRFALNGTYFQVNEVFADHETSVEPIRVSRELLWNLPKRRVYCAAAGRSIFTDMSLLEIHRCFWNGFICVRGFDRKTREPQDLHTRFHIAKTTTGKPKNENDSKRKPKGTKKGRKDDNDSKTNSKGAKKGSLIP